MTLQLAERELRQKLCSTPAASFLSNFVRFVFVCPFTFRTSLDIELWSRCGDFWLTFVHSSLHTSEIPYRTHRFLIVNHLNRSATSWQSSANFNPVLLLTTSSNSGCMKIAKVFLAIRCPSLDAAPERTKCGAARNLPSVINCKASPVWKARQSGGIVTFVIVDVRD